MAYFAELDTNNKVIQVIAVNNDVILDENNFEQESIGIEFCKSLYGQDTNWIQTSYNKNIRREYASIGMFYDPTGDQFIHPQPYPSWVLGADGEWQAPIPMPVEEGKVFVWNEETLSWDEIVIPTE
jgi:hypothetical protein